MIKNTSKTRLRKLLPYFAPMIINLIAFTLIQLWLMAQCTSDCNAIGYVNTLIVFPGEIIVFIACLVIIGIGINKERKLTVKRRTYESRLSRYILAAFFILISVVFWIAIGNFATPATTVPLFIGTILLIIQATKDNPKA